MHLFLERVSVLTLNRLAVLRPDSSLFLGFPINDRGASLAFSYLSVRLLRLPIGHPARIAVALHHKLHRVSTTVTVAGRRIHRQGTVSAGIPRLLPRCGSLLQLFNQRLGHLCIVVICFCHILLPHDEGFEGRAYLFGADGAEVAAIERKGVLGHEENLLVKDHLARKGGNSLLPLAVGQANAVYPNTLIRENNLVACRCHNALDQKAVPAGANAIRNEATRAPIARHHVFFVAEQNEIAFMNRTLLFEINAKGKAARRIHHEKTACQGQKHQHEAKSKQATLQKRRGPAALHQRYLHRC